MHIIIIYVNKYLSEAISLSDEIIVLSKRPAIVKRIHKIDFSSELLPTEKRRTTYFNDLYDKIWKDIDSHV